MKRFKKFLHRRLHSFLRRPYDFPRKIDASPEELAQAVAQTPPKKPDEWRYMNRPWKLRLPGKRNRG